MIIDMDWNSQELESILERSLQEDIGPGDITGETVVSPTREASADFLAKEPGVLAGFPLVERIFRKLDPGAGIDVRVAEGATFSKGDILGSIHGKARAVLAGERLSLNFLQRLCGIATRTSEYVRLASSSGIRILDTRKTTPMLRNLEKYAVKMGGGTNHRMGLYDAPMVKDNHLQIQPDFGAILQAFQKKGYSAERVELEVATPEMLQRAIAAGGRWFLLDNMTPEQIRECVSLKQPGMIFEVSGGVDLSNITKYLIPGVDFISIGALTHSVRSLDISLEMR